MCGDCINGIAFEAFEAFEASGGSAGSETMTVGQGVPETLRITGTAIEKAVIIAPQDETLLLRLCYEPA